MTLQEFQRYVEEHSHPFRGVHPESPESLQAAEQALGLTLPESLKWQLSRWGYSRGCGIDALDDAIEATLRGREKCAIPARIFLLERLWRRLDGPERGGPGRGKPGLLGWNAQLPAAGDR
jgi:hypothetical protein